MRRKKLKLILLLVLSLSGLGFVCDAARTPDKQLTAHAYVGCVHVYQAVGRPLLKGYVTCRFRPTCSDYSIAAVERHGIVRGLGMTYRRIRSCTNEVPMGTIDKVPD